MAASDICTAQEAPWWPPDKSFSKVIVTKGEGLYNPSDGSLCTVTINKFQPDTVTEEDIGYPVEKETEVEIGEGDTIISGILDHVLETMKIGEVCKVEFSVPKDEVPKDEDQQETESESGCSCEFRIELKDYKRNVESWDMEQEEKLNMAKYHKNKGVELHKKGNKKFAFNRFSRALKLLIAMGPVDCVPTELLADYRYLKCTCYLNLAAEQLIHGQYEFVVENCTQALELDSNNIKALYRRGQAYLKLKDIDNAKLDLEVAHVIDPKNTAILKEMNSVDGILKQSEEKLAIAMKKMFAAK